MGYRNAEICKKGHLISAASNSSNHSKHCQKCGEETINSCPHCKAPIRGWYEVEGVVNIRSSKTKFPIPLYCHNCGNPYPWIENNQKKLNSLLLIDSVLTDDEKGILREYLPDLTIDDDNSLTSAVLVKSISDKASNTTSEFIKNFVLTLAVDSVKKFFGF